MTPVPYLFIPYLPVCYSLGTPDVTEKVQSVTIKEGDTGFSYERLFSSCLDGNLEWVEVEDPYIKARHQVHNFVRFCELLVRRGGRKLNRVELHTGRGEVYNMAIGQVCKLADISLSLSQPDQRRQLDELGSSLAHHGVTLSVVYSDTLHDRQIR